MRIVSLLPSATEILFAVGAGDDVVGVTFECDHPEEARSRTIVSTTTLPPGLSPAEIDAAVRERLAAGEDLYRLDEGALRSLDPDVVVTQDLCAVCAVDVDDVDAALDHLGCRAEVITLDPMTLDDVLASIERVGDVTDTRDRAGALVADLRTRLQRVADAVSNRPRPRMALLEWTDPPFAPGHWLPDMVAAAGAVSAIGAAGERSRAIEWGHLAHAQPDQIVVVPCGYRLDGATALANELLAQGRLPAGAEVWAVDADAAFVRPGPRVVDGVETLAAIAHPGVITAPEGLARRVN
ncbi:MAG: ABC transporter substrate-binding protein [Actinobacteria bacterium]|nr:ABC transporter substrate-binding protein [Actinomycetota bacterium]MBV9932723.1 ABC transporter substrate-binding protein [Actinomycetota bacterium]